MMRKEVAAETVTLAVPGGKRPGAHRETWVTTSLIMRSGEHFIRAPARKHT